MRLRHAPDPLLRAAPLSATFSRSAVAQTRSTARAMIS
jgi:hypothetical protein